jgi:hypothetical protein
MEYAVPFRPFSALFQEVGVAKAQQARWRPGSNLVHLGDLRVLGGRYLYRLGTTMSGEKFLYISVAGKPRGISILADNIDAFVQATTEWGETVKAESPNPNLAGPSQQVTALSAPTSCPGLQEPYRSFLIINGMTSDDPPLQAHAYDPIGMIEGGHEDQQCRTCGYHPEKRVEYAVAVETHHREQEAREKKKATRTVKAKKT